MLSTVVLHGIFVSESLRKICLSPCVSLFSSVYITIVNVFVYATTEPENFCYFRNEIHSPWKLFSGIIFAKNYFSHYLFQIMQPTSLLVFHKNTLWNEDN